MTQLSAHLDTARQEAAPFVERFARFGYAAKGVVYVIIGALAAAAAFGAGGETTGSKGALETLAQQPMGKILLGIVGLGLCGYSLWQFIRAVEDPEGEGRDAKAIAKRIHYFGSGVLHFLLVMYAMRIIIGSGGGGGDDQAPKSLSAQAMSYPLGRWAVGIAGASIVIYGLYQLFRAFKGKLDKQLRLYGLQEEARKAAMFISRFGIAARGVVFAIMGVFLVLAAWRYDPNEARGVGGAMHALEEQPYGPWLLATVAIGMIAYGVYEFIRAVYRQIKPT